MSGSQERFGIRLSLDGAQEFESGLRRAGETGRQAMAGIAQGAQQAGQTTGQASAVMGQLGSAAGTAGTQMTEMARRMAEGQSATGALAQSIAAVVSTLGPAGAIAGAAITFAAVSAGVMRSVASVRDLNAAVREVSGNYDEAVAGLERYSNRVARLVEQTEQYRRAREGLTAAEVRAEDIAARVRARAAESVVERIQTAAGQGNQNAQGLLNTPIARMAEMLPLIGLSITQMRILGQVVADARGEFEIMGVRIAAPAAALREINAVVERFNASARGQEALVSMAEEFQRLADRGGVTRASFERLRDVTLGQLSAMRDGAAAVDQANAAYGNFNTTATRTASVLATIRSMAVAAVPNTAVLDETQSRLNREFTAAVTGGREGLDRARAQSREEDARNAAIRTGQADLERRLQEAATRGGGPRLTDRELADRVSQGMPDIQRRAEEIARTQTGLANLEAGFQTRGGGTDNTERELERLNQQYRQLLGSLDPVVAILNQYEDGERQLNEALAANVITQTQYDAALSQLSDRRERDIERLGTQTEAYRRATQAAEQDAKQLGQALGSAFEAAIIQGKDLGTVLKSLEQDLLRIMTRRLITQPLSDFFSESMKPGADGSGGGIMGLVGGVTRLFGFHDGGTVGGYTAHSFAAHPAAFMGAPRYHVGGVAGMRPGDVPSILKMGERIRTPEQEADLAGNIRALASRRGAPMVVNINATDVGSFIRSKAQVTRELFGAWRMAQRNI